MKTLKFDSLKEAFSELNVQNKGYYYLCNCPHCGHHEGFFYLKEEQNFFIIKCNRLTHCGKTTKVIFAGDKKDIKKVVLDYKPSYKKNELDISSIGKERLVELCNSSSKIPEVFRGISKDTLKNYIVFKNVSKIFGKPEDKIFGTRYFKPLYSDRDVLIPIRNKDGVPERVLLRATKPLKPKDSKQRYLKEFQLRIVDDGNEIWNVSDLYDSQKEVVFVCEGVFDALSIKDALKGALVSKKCGYIALTGVGKFSQITKLLKEDTEIDIKHKLFIICFDLDKAGIKYSNKFNGQLKQLGVGCFNFKYELYNPPLSPDGTIDMNDWYQKDKVGFKRAMVDITYPYSTIPQRWK